MPDTEKKNPAWWPTAEQKRHADAGCAHPDECRVPSPDVSATPLAPLTTNETREDT